MKYRVILYVAILFTGIIQSCGEAQFFGFNDKLSGRDGAPPNGQAPLPGDEEPLKQTDLTVIALVDMSAKSNPSQRPHQNPGQNPLQQPGQGPAQISLHDILCAKQQRLIGLIEALAEEKNQWRDIRIGLIPYADEILVDRITDPVSLDEAKQNVLDRFFCDAFPGAADLHAAEGAANERLGGERGRIRILAVDAKGVQTLVDTYQD